MGVFSNVWEKIKETAEKIKEKTIFSEKNKSSKKPSPASWHRPLPGPSPPRLSSTTTTTTTSRSTTTSTGGTRSGGGGGTRRGGGGSTGGGAKVTSGGSSDAYFKPEVIEIQGAEKYTSYSSKAYPAGTQLITTEIPKEERIIEPPSTFQRLFGFLTSPFSAAVTEKYTSSKYSPGGFVLYSPTPTGKGTMIYEPYTLPESELKKLYPHAYYASLVQSASYQAQQTYQSIYQSRIEKEFKKELWKVGLRGYITFEEGKAIYTGPQETFDLAKQLFEIAAQRAHARVSEFATQQTTKKFETEVARISHAFERQYKTELLRAKPYDIAYQSGVAVITGGLAGSAFTTISYAAPPTVSKGLTIAGVAAGGFFGYKEARRIAQEYSLTKAKFGEPLAKKELTLNIVGTAATTAAFAGGWAIGSKITTANILKSQRVVLERGTFIAREIDKHTLVGKGTSTQVVQYDVKVPLFGKKTVTEYRLIEYPFITQVGKGVKGFGSLVGQAGKTERGIVGGYNVLFQTEKGSKIFGVPQNIGRITSARTFRLGDIALTKFYAERGLGIAQTAIGRTAPGMTYFGKTTVSVYRVFSGKPYFIRSFTFQPSSFETFVSTSAKKVGVFGTPREQGGYMRELYKGFIKIEKTARGATTKFKAPTRLVYQEAAQLGPRGYEKFYSQKVGLIIEQPRGSAAKMIIWKGKTPTPKPFEFFKPVTPKPSSAIKPSIPKPASFFESSAGAGIRTGGAGGFGGVSGGVTSVTIPKISAQIVPSIPALTPSISSSVISQPKIITGFGVGAGFKIPSASSISSLAPTSLKISREIFRPIITQKEFQRPKDTDITRFTPAITSTGRTEETTRQRFIPSIKEISKQIEIAKPIPIPKIGFPKFSFTPSPSKIVIPPTIPTLLPFSLPKIGGFLPSDFQKSVLGKRSYRYQPSFAAIVLKIKAPKVPRTSITGFTIRPIPIVKRRRR